jgi:hypothetical protein
VYVRELTATERDTFEIGQAAAAKAAERIPAYMRDPDSPPSRNFRAALVVLAVCDEAGAPLLKPSDLAQLGKKSAAIVDRLFDVAARLSGITKDETEKTEGKSSAPSAG